MRVCKIFIIVFAAIILSWTQVSFAAMSNDEVLIKLNELSTIIQKQQQEIQMLKQELKNQKKQVDNVQKTEKEEEKIATEEKSKVWGEDIPEWIKKIKISGDLRLRYENIWNREQQLEDGSSIDQPTFDRYRIRARLFFDSNITDEVSAHLMLTTDQDRNLEATTSNMTMRDDFNNKGIYIGRAYAAYKPNWLNGLELTGGKFKNTFMYTDIMWDPDVNPEGFYEYYKYSGWEKFEPFIHLGQMTVNNVRINTERDDPWLFINQAGFNWKLGPVTWTLAASHYNWTHLENTRYLHNADYKGGGGNTFILDANGDIQYAYDYKLWEGISFVKFKIGHIPTKLMVDYIVNTADDVPGDYDTAYFVGFELGKTKHKGDWSLLYKYARIENDAVIGSMNDQDFYGANRKGSKIKFRYMLFDRLQFATAYFHTSNLNAWVPDSPLWLINRFRMPEDRLQFDLIFKF